MAVRGMFEVCVMWIIMKGSDLIVCIRFATELAGRKARRKGWDGLAEEMTKAGWFET